MLRVELKLHTKADCRWAYKAMLVSHGGQTTSDQFCLCIQILSGDTEIEFCSKGNAIFSTRACSCGVLMKILAVVQILSGDTKIEFCSKENAIFSTREFSCGVLMKIRALIQILSGDTKIEFCSKGTAIFSTRECS